jgi:hypothetical protein
MGCVYIDTCSTILPGELITYNFKHCLTMYTAVLDMPTQAVPRRHCMCDFHGGAEPAQALTAGERHATNAAQREWALHALTCPKGVGGAWGSVGWCTTGSARCSR